MKIEEPIVVEKTATNSQFWPKGIVIEDVRSPIEILNKAARDWLVGSDGALTLNILIAPEDHLEVYAINTGGGSDYLFCVTTEENNGYPCTVTMAYHDSEVDCHSPIEIEAALVAALNASEVRSAIYNLLIKCQGSIASEVP